MEIIQAPEVVAMPYGLLSVMDVGNENRSAYAGFRYEVGCGTGIGWTGGPCEEQAQITGLAVEITFSSALTEAGSVDWGDGETSTVAVDATTASHTYDVDGTYVIVVNTSQGGVIYTVTVDADNAEPREASAGKADTGEITQVFASRFVVYAMTSCSLVGRDPAINGAVDRMNASESHVLEQVLSTFAQDIGAGADTIDDAVSELQANWYERTHGVRPIIHINAALLGYVKGADRHGNRLELKNGALVSAGSGYPLDKVIITGAPTVQRGTMVTSPVQDVVNNTHIDFAERYYALTPGCEGALSAEITPPWAE